MLTALGCEPAPLVLSDQWQPLEATRAWLMSGRELTPGRTLVVGGEFREGHLYWLDGADGSLERWATPFDDAGLYTWSHATSENDVWVVTLGPTLIHWDGSSWSRFALGYPTRPLLWGVYTPAPDRGWAVGGDGTTTGEPLLLEWNGAEWAPRALPDLGTHVNMLYKIWGSSVDDVWVVGGAGAVYHHDGSAWEGTLLETSGAAWFNVSGVDGVVVVVGGNSHAVVGRWDGVEWMVRELPELPVMSGVWMRRPDVAHVTGANGFVGVLDVETLEVVRDDRVGPFPYHTVFGAGDALVAVGGDLDSSSLPLTGALTLRRIGDGE